MSALAQNQLVTRFVGRPASVCRKCRGSQFIVNQFGGIECQSCTKEQGEFPMLYVVAGKYSDEPDEFGPVPGAVAPVAPVDQSEPEKPAKISDIDWADWYWSRVDSQENRWAKPKERVWADVSDELAMLVECYKSARMFGLLPTEPFELHRSGRPARSLQDMNHQLTKRVVNPEAFYRSLDCEIDVQGPRGPRARTGTLQADLERLKVIGAIES